MRRITRGLQVGGDPALRYRDALGRSISGDAFGSRKQAVYTARQHGDARAAVRWDGYHCSGRRRTRASGVSGWRSRMRSAAETMMSCLSW